MIKAAMVAATILAATAICSPVFAKDICSVGALAPRDDSILFTTCNGSLTADMAIYCVNKLATETEEQRMRADRAIAQAECLCNALDKFIPSVFVKYYRMNNTCSVMKIGP